MTPVLNLLDPAVRREEIQTVLERQPRRPLLPPLGSPEWTRVAAHPLVQKLTEPLRTKAEEECGQPLPGLSDELYASFKQTGVRLTFERVYFERRRRVARAGLSLLLAAPGDPWGERLTASTVEKLEAVFDEVSWALPAHVNWHNDDLSGKEPLQIDLFAAETANFIAEMLDVFGAIIPAPLQRRMRERLRTGIFENYLGRDFHWMSVTHNWNAVCHQGVVGAALSQIDNPAQLAVLLDRARRHLPNFLSGFGPDGGCSEGPSYWNYGFGWFTALNEQLETRSGGELSFFEGDEHIHAIARYGPRMALANSHLVNFADGPASAGLSPSTLDYLGRRLAEPDCAAASRQAYQTLVRRGLVFDGERTDLFCLLRLFLRLPADLAMDPVPPAADCFLPDLSVLVARGADLAGHLWEFAAKGGHNGEHHNHNDCGSFLLNIDGGRLITEIGAPEYVHEFFQPDTRYTYLAARSLGHSVPFVNGCEQKEGAAFAARTLSHSLGTDEVSFVLDLTACYPAEARLKKLVRAFTWHKSAGYLRVEDTFALDGPGEIESLIVAETPWVLAENSAQTHSGAITLKLMLPPGLSATTDTDSFRSRLGADRVLYRLRLKPAESTSEGRIACEIRL